MPERSSRGSVSQCQARCNGFTAETYSTKRKPRDKSTGAFSQTSVTDRAIQGTLSGLAQRVLHKASHLVNLGLSRRRTGQPHSPDCCQKPCNRSVGSGWLYNPSRRASVLPCRVGPVGGHWLCMCPAQLTGLHGSYKA